MQLCNYAYYFNKRYGRTGHLFQDRFKSEVIEDEAYLLAAIRYVHNNLVKAKVVTDPSAYKWSSYNLYLNKDNSGRRIEKEMILEMFSIDQDKAIKLFVNHANEVNEDVFLDHEDAVDEGRTILDERSARVFMVNFLRERSQEVELSVFIHNKNLRGELIRELKQKSNLSVRGIASLLNISRGVVQRVKV